MASPTRPGQAREAYSRLEVANDHAHNAPEVDLRHQPDKEAVDTKEEKYGTHAHPKRRICGMRRPIAFVFFGIIALLVVGAVVGGAVGSTQASSSNKSTSPTTTASAGATSTTSSISTPSSTTTTTSISTSTLSSSSTAAPSATPIGEGEGTVTCPESDNTDYTTTSGTGGLVFRQLCDVDWPVGITAISGAATDTVVDLSIVLEYSMTDCIEQCAVYSLNNSPPCVAVTYGANVTSAQSRGIGGNCFLKNARGERNLADTSGQVESAYLIEG